VTTNGSASNTAATLSRGVSTAAYRYQARITVHVAAEVAAERIPTVGVIESVDLNTCLVHTGSNSLDELTLYLGLFNLFGTRTAPGAARRSHVTHRSFAP
jgi:hypothetical protein